MQENQIHILAAEAMPGIKRLRRRIDQSEVHDFHAGPGEFCADFPQITFEPFLEAGELRPVSVETYAEQADADGMFHLPEWLVPAAERTDVVSITHDHGG